MILEKINGKLSKSNRIEREKMRKRKKNREQEAKERQKRKFQQCLWEVYASEGTRAQRKAEATRNVAEHTG